MNDTSWNIPFEPIPSEIEISIPDIPFAISDEGGRCDLWKFLTRDEDNNVDERLLNNSLRYYQRFYLWIFLHSTSIITPVEEYRLDRVYFEINSHISESEKIVLNRVRFEATTRTLLAPRVYARGEILLERGEAGNFIP